MRMRRPVIALVQVVPVPVSVVKPAVMATVPVTYSATVCSVASPYRPRQLVFSAILATRALMYSSRITESKPGKRLSTSSLMLPKFAMVFSGQGDAARREYALDHVVVVREFAQLD